MLRQKYALKILSGDAMSSIGWRRFQTEARTIAKLDHLNIIKVHNLGIHADRVPYYVMELIDGETLASVVRREGALELETVIDLFVPLCEGLSYAHSRGVVHRDIKPSKIMLVQGARSIVPKLVDFGLVKLVGDALSPSQQLTATGEVFGSPLYMSPEQSVGRHINERSDIYSLGCSLFETLTGAPPFVGENIVQTILKHQNEEPPSLKEASMGLDFSPEWEAVVKRVLAKEADDRYQTMDELAQDLRAIKEGKKLSVQYTTTGDGDLFSESETEEAAPQQKNLGKARVSAASALILALCVIAFSAGSYFAVKQKSAPKEAHVTGLNYGGVQPEQAVTVTSDEIKELENISIPFAQNGGKPVNNQKVFKFPKDISLGNLVHSFADPKIKAVVHDAKGEFAIPDDGMITFEANNYCGVHPKIFRKFLPTDLQGLVLYGGATDTDDELFYINHLESLRVLNLDGTDVTAKGMQIVDSLPNLIVLSMVHTYGVTGADMAKLKCLRRLTSISFSRNKDPGPMLEALVGSPNMLNMTFDYTPLTATDIKLLARMPNLRGLSLNSCNLTADSIEPLANMPQLERLNIRGNSFSPKLIDLFKDKRIAWLELSTPHWSAADIARLQTALGPRCKFHDFVKPEI
jgi:serine/threonine protein kinase